MPRSDAIIEQIDIGGPAMVRASAKNHGSVAVVVDPASYGDVLSSVQEWRVSTWPPGVACRRWRSVTRPATTLGWPPGWAATDRSTSGDSGFPGWIAGSWERAAVLRYGENPHQAAALYVSHDTPPGIAQAEQLHGKEMSYNNYVDGDAAYRAAYDFKEPCVAIIKHANPCGIARWSQM